MTSEFDEAMRRVMQLGLPAGGLIGPILWKKKEEEEELQLGMS